MTITVVVFLFYLFWGMLSITCQGNHPIVKQVKSCDILGLLPNYKFFCPNPIRNDYHLYYRRLVNPEQWSDWEEVYIHQRSLFLGFFWNPEKRSRKVFTSTIKAVLNKYQRKPLKAKGAIYDFFLHYIQYQASLKGDQPLQFKITSKMDLDRFSNESELFLSPIHPALT